MMLARLVLVTIAAAIPIGALAALSPAHTAFIVGPAQFLMTKEEQKSWKDVTTDPQAEAFINAFWARRDPTPGTPANEYREEYQRRIETANLNFAQAKKTGSMTDRGRIFIVLGPPTRIQRTSPEPKSTVQTPEAALRPLAANENSVQSYSSKQLWMYEQGKISYPLGQPVVEVAFVDQYGSQDWKLDRSPRTDINGLLDRVNRAAIVQPTATGASVAAVVATPAAVVAPAATPSGLAAAVRAASGAKPLFVTYGEFITPEGEYFVPVQLFLPRGSGLSPDQDVTFFGEITDGAGKVVSSFEEAGRLTASKDDLFYARTLTMPAGSYKGTFAVVRGGAPVAIAKADLTLAALDKSAAASSRLMLANNVYPLAEAQRPTDPFAFGGVKVVPKSDLTFVTADELWYFFEIRYPGLDPTTGAPKMQTQVTITGKRADGKTTKMQGPTEDAVLQELKGVAGHFGVGAAIPLETFKPGDYTIKIKVTDKVTSQTFNLEQNFKVSGAGS